MHSFLRLSSIPLYMCTTASLSIHLLGCFYVLAIVNSAVVNIGIHVSFSILVSSGYMPNSGIAGSYGGFIPSFLSNLYTVFYSGRISLHCHQQCKSVPFSLQPLQHLLFVDFLTVAILTDIWRRQWHPTPVLLPGKSCGRRSLVGYSSWGR